MFTKPLTQGSRFFKPADHEGHLILITKVQDKRTVEDKYKGEVTAVFVDFVDLDGSGDAHLSENVQITHGGIVNRLETGMENVLARVGKAPTSKGYAAWVLKGPAVEDEATATKWLESGKTVAQDDVPQDEGWGSVA